ncbi:MAG: hypothetical protein AAGJ93_10790 [Bacteroidota bacterium]
MRFFTLILTLCSLVQLIGQDVDTSSTFLPFQQHIRLESNNLAVSIMPLSTIRMGRLNSYPRFRGGVQLDRKDITYLLDLEYGNNSLIVDSDSPYVYYGFRPEIQNHFNTYDKGTIYCGLTFVFSYDERNIERETYQSTDGNRYSIDAARLKRVKTMSMIKLGVVHHIGDNFYADLYIGMGSGNKNTAYLNPENKRINTNEPTQAWFSSSDGADEGNMRIPALAFGIRFSYKFIN